MNIICVESLGIPQTRFEELKKHYASMGHEFTYYLDRKEDEETLIERMREADIAVISNIKLPAAVLSQCPKLRYLSVAFTGLDHIDLAYCKEHSIEVQNAAGYSTTAVSELAVGMMLDLQDLLQKRVDLVTEKGLLPFARESVDRDKILIYERAA